jgi:hypothetical protein
MYAPFATMSSQTVKLAKDYPAEQILTAEQTRIAPSTHETRRPIGARLSAFWTGAASLHTQPAPAPE